MKRCSRSAAMKALSMASCCARIVPPSSYADICELTSISCLSLSETGRYVTEKHRSKSKNLSNEVLTGYERRTAEETAYFVSVSMPLSFLPCGSFNGQNR